MTRKLPNHIPGTSREWKRRKRAELKAVLAALDVFVIGCAYTPAKDVGVVQQKVRDWRDQLSARKWGR